MSNQIIGDKGLSCPWCGKSFIIRWSDLGTVTVICSNSDCVIVPSGIFNSVEDAEKALRDRIE